MDRTRHEQASGKETVVVTITGSDASVDLRHVPLVAPVLETERVAWGGRGGTVAGRLVRQWHGQRTGDTYTFPPKLAPLVASRLEAQGIACEVRGFAPRRPSGWDAAGATVRELLGAPGFAALGGLIPPGWGRDPHELVLDLLQLFPERRAVVATRNRDGVRHWLEYLTGTIDRPVHRPRDDRVWRDRDAVIVGSLPTLELLLRAEDFGLIVVLDIAPLMARLPVVAAVPGRRTRRVPPYCSLRDPCIPAFGFLRHAERLSAAERLTLMSYFARVLRPAKTEARVRVSVATVAPTSDVPGELLAAKRAVWADPARNDRIAQLAAAQQTDQRVVVLCGSTAHAVELAHRLDGWAIATGEWDAALPGRAIVTEGWLARGGRFGADVVVDARGWGPLQPADFTLNPVVTLIDVPAAGHPTFVARTASRHDAYESYGWSIDSTGTQTPAP